MVDYDVVVKQCEGFRLKMAAMRGDITKSADELSVRLEAVGHGIGHERLAGVADQLRAASSELWLVYLSLGDALRGAEAVQARVDREQLEELGLRIEE